MITISGYSHPMAYSCGGTFYHETGLVGQSWALPVVGDSADAVHSTHVRRLVKCPISSRIDSAHGWIVQFLEGMIKQDLPEGAIPWAMLPTTREYDA